MTDDTIPFSFMKEQVGKKNVTHSPSKWVYPTENQTEDEFHASDEIPYGTTPNATSFAVMKKQVRKKKVSKKSKEQRIEDKSVSLAERLGNGESEETI